ncbi:hypothetical protein QFC22_003664 [Naganishia vaughanmartiniae]|uniref:Uncharacterized protein n=1 Tax=Naganishia vaughanmartiniae TaxID=1424756 RepID=A0ACC2X7C4_9TREE|nr:hypothetical protein QFC22_003664 [Naganishia vaughanmartiniae]
MSGGNQPYYLPTFGNDANRQPQQHDASSRAGLAQSGVASDVLAFASNNQPGGYPGANSTGTVPSYQGASMPNQYGIPVGAQGHASVPIEFSTTFSTPRTNPVMHMAGGSPSTQNFPSAPYGSFTQSPTSMHDQIAQIDTFQGVPDAGGIARGHPFPESQSAEDGMGHPPNKKKKGKNGEAVVSGSGSGTEDKEKEKEKDNRRKTWHNTRSEHIDRTSAGTVQTLQTSEAGMHFLYADHGNTIQEETRHSQDLSLRHAPSVNPPQRKSSAHSQGGRYEGPTSISFLLHSAPSLPRSTIEEYDLRNHQTWQLTTDDGDGLIKVFNPPPTAEAKEAANSPSQGLSGQSVLSSKLISSLINSYFQHVAPLFPIVAKSDFIKGRKPPPLLLYAMAGVAATRRGVSRDVFNAIRTIINGIIRNNDVLGDASIENVQALVGYVCKSSSEVVSQHAPFFETQLILGMAADLHAQPVSTAVSASVTRLAAAIRMAQNLGLHRESVASSQDTDEMENIELRRRVWAACVLFDRWCGASLGLPLLIDLQDCDCLVPAPYEFVRDANPPQWQIVDDPPYSHLAEHLKLSVLMGRVLKCIYSPVGLMHTTNEQLGALISDLGQWQAQLPPNLQYTGPDSSLGAGMLHASFTALQFLMWRPFLRLQFTLPKHIKLAMNIATWSKLLKLSHEVIEWLEQHEDALDTIYVFAYAISNCALIQYHTWVRRREDSSLRALETLRNIVQRWEAALQPDHMSIRRKTIEVMTLLYEAAKKAHKDDLQINSSALNPTTGVKRRHPDMLRKIVWRPDPNQPSHGVFVATDLDPNSELLTDLAPNTLITGTQDPSPRDPANAPQSMQQLQHGLAVGSMSAQPISQWSNPEATNGENVTYLHLDPALTYLPDMSEIPPSTGEAYDTAMLLNMFDQAVSRFLAFLSAGAQSQSPSLPQGNQSTVTQAALVDQNMLEGLPTGFDWNAWDTYFNRFDGLSTQMAENGTNLGSGPQLM